MGHVETLTDIPEDRVDDKAAMFEAEGATVEKIKQEDGNWTIKATFPNG